MKNQHTSSPAPRIKRLLSKTLTTACMALSFMTAFDHAAYATNPIATSVRVDNGFLNAATPYFYKTEVKATGTFDGEDCTAWFDASTGTLHLWNYDGDYIADRGKYVEDLTIVLKGNNYIKRITANSSNINTGILISGGNLTVTSTTGGALSIYSENMFNTGAAGIYNRDLSLSGDVTIAGNAVIDIMATTNAIKDKGPGATDFRVLGIYGQNITILNDAEVHIETILTEDASQYGIVMGAGIHSVMGDIIINTTGSVSISNNSYYNGVTITGKQIRPILVNTSKKFELLNAGKFTIGGMIVTDATYNSSAFHKSITKHASLPLHEIHTYYNRSNLSALVFTNSNSYHVPSGTVGTTTAGNNFSGGVSGGIPFEDVNPYKYNLSGPAWLEAGFNKNTGVLTTSTRPLTAQASSTAIITAEDFVGQKKSITIVVGSVLWPSLVFTANSEFDIPAGTTGTAITPVNVSGSASGGVGEYTFSIIGPEWLVIDPETGIISGTRPTTPQAPRDIAVRVTDDEGQMANITINVGRVSIGDLEFAYSTAFDIEPDAIETEITTIDLSTAVSGGVTPYTFKITGGKDWFELNPSTGVISGYRPAWVQSEGTSTIRVTDASGKYQEIKINVGAVTASATQTVTVGSQNGTVTNGTAGIVTFDVTTTDIVDGRTATVAWFDDLNGTTPITGTTLINLNYFISSGAAISVSSGEATVTINTDSWVNIPARLYYFQLTIDGVKSNIETLTVLNSVSLYFDYYSGFDVPTGLCETAIDPIDMSARAGAGVRPYTFTVEGSDWLSISGVNLVGIRPETAEEPTTAIIRVTDRVGATATIEINVGQVWAQSYMVIVNGGLAGFGAKDDWFPGEEVIIMPDTPAGYDFDSWIVNSGGVSITTNELGYFFTMPAGHVEVTAKFVKTPPEFPLTFTYDSAFDVPSGECGSSFTTVDVSTGVNGGFDPYAYNIIGPDWLEIDENGIISAIDGYRPVERLSETTALIVVTDAEGEVAFITVNVGAVTLPYMILPDYDIPTDEPGIAITSIDLLADLTGGSGSYTFEKISGPDWLEMDEHGVITGVRPGMPKMADLLIISVTDDVMGDMIYVYINIGATLDASTTYAVTAANGTADKTAVSECDLVTITANEAPEGYMFDKWVVKTGGAILDDEESEITCFYMPASAVEVEATYKDIPEPTYTVTVTSGTGGGDYAEEATVTITANAPESGKVFDKWTTTDGVIFANENNATTTFTMPAKAVTVTATYKDIPVTTYTVTVTSGTGGGDFAEGATVSITANAAPAGQQFKNWTSTPAVAFADANNASTTFTMPANAVTVTAVFEFAPVTSSKELQLPNPLRAWTRNGLLHIEGVTSGETLSIYTASGVLVYRSVATADEADIALQAQGVYIVRQGERTVKVTFEN